MEQKKVMMTDTEAAKEMLNDGILPWWAVMTLAKRCGSQLPPKYMRHTHHCSACGCIMICTHKNCGHSGIYCPACSEKNPLSQGGK